MGSLLRVVAVALAHLQGDSINGATVQVAGQPMLATDELQGLGVVLAGQRLS